MNSIQLKERSYLCIPLLWQKSSAMLFNSFSTRFSSELDRGVMH